MARATDKRMNVRVDAENVVIELPIDLMVFAFDVQFEGDYRIKGKKAFAAGLAKYLKDFAPPHGEGDSGLELLLSQIFEEMVSSDESYTAEMDGAL